MYRAARVVEVAKLTESVKLYRVRLAEPFEASPGQFVMLWIPGVGEIPLSVANMEGNELWLVIAKKGRVTSFIHENVKAGSKAFLRGPLGRGFSLRERPTACLLVAGGYGLAPLYFLAKKLSERGVICDALLGFKTSKDVFFTEEFGRICRRVFVSTEDGSYGFKGLVTDLIGSSVKIGDYSAVYTTGKEQMMKRVVEACLREGIYVEASLERLVRCGVGLCGACSLDPLGLRVCKDGPVFEGSVLKRLTDFGRYWRDESGRKIALRHS